MDDISLSITHQRRIQVKREELEIQNVEGLISTNSGLTAALCFSTFSVLECEQCLSVALLRPLGLRILC